MLRAIALRRWGEVDVRHWPQSEKTLPDERAGYVNRKGSTGRVPFPRSYARSLTKPKIELWLPEPLHCAAHLVSHVVRLQAPLSQRDAPPDMGASGGPSSSNLTGVTLLLFSGTEVSVGRIGPGGIAQQQRYFNILHSKAVVCPFPDSI